MSVAEKKDGYESHTLKGLSCLLYYLYKLGVVQQKYTDLTESLKSWGFTTAQLVRESSSEGHFPAFILCNKKTQIIKQLNQASWKCFLVILLQHTKKEKCSTHKSGHCSLSSDRWIDSFSLQTKRKRVVAVLSPNNYTRAHGLRTWLPVFPTSQRLFVS
jgi:hypothetical protein